jgi:hypothetical protein
LRVHRERPEELMNGSGVSFTISAVAFY